MCVFERWDRGGEEEVVCAVGLETKSITKYSVIKNFSFYGGGSPREHNTTILLRNKAITNCLLFLMISATSTKCVNNKIIHSRWRKVMLFHNLKKKKSNNFIQSLQFSLKCYSFFFIKYVVELDLLKLSSVLTSNSTLSLINWFYVVRASTNNH